MRAEVGHPVGERRHARSCGPFGHNPSLCPHSAAPSTGRCAAGRGSEHGPPSSAPPQHTPHPSARPVPPDHPGGRAGRRPPHGRAVAALRQVGPNWYAAVMGTAIIANAGAALPGCPGWLRAACTVVWALSALLLAAVLAARAGHWVAAPRRGARGLLDPAVAPFYGCLPMALLAVGSARLGARRGRWSASALRWRWTRGCGRWAADRGARRGRGAVPDGRAAPDRRRRGASPVWLLPVVGPDGAASLGPALVPHLAAGAQGREALLLGCLRDVRHEPAGHAGDAAGGLRAAGPPRAAARSR